MIVIPRHILEDMLEHARADAPVEACGLLAGVREDAPARDELSTGGNPQSDRSRAIARKYYRLTNVDGSEEHYSLDPREQFAAVKDMRARDMEMVAVYHSHPASPARMSEEDLRLALTPGILYVIVSLMNPGLPEVRSYAVEDGRPVEAPLVIGDDAQKY